MTNEERAREVIAAADWHNYIPASIARKLAEGFAAALDAKERETVERCMAICKYNGSQVYDPRIPSQRVADFCADAIGAWGVSTAESNEFLRKHGVEIKDRTARAGQPDGHEGAESET